ncbi:hypothetical protein J6590_088388 [Homalodisca vitripennis]|nr:hypothetical protein J6590_088388 [Homalodisca vitripennis]
MAARPRPLLDPPPPPRPPGKTPQPMGEQQAPSLTPPRAMADERSCHGGWTKICVSGGRYPNPGPSECETVALTTGPRRRVVRGRDRARQVRTQKVCPAAQDLNPGPAERIRRALRPLGWHTFKSDDCSLV